MQVPGTAGNLHSQPTSMRRWTSVLDPGAAVAGGAAGGVALRDVAALTEQTDGRTDRHRAVRVGRSALAALAAGRVGVRIVLLVATAVTAIVTRERNTTEQRGRARAHRDDRGRQSYPAGPITEHVSSSTDRRI